MKNHIYKIIVLCICLIIFKSGAIGQTIVNDAQYKYGETALRNKIEEKFREECKKNDLNVCLIATVFAKFTIDSTGNIGHLNFSKTVDTSMVFKNILKAVILSTNGLWTPRIINGKRVESRPFILPLIYAMEAGCNQQELQKANSKKSYHEVPNTMEGDMLNVLNFDGNPESGTNQLDCILLAPLHVFSQN